MVFQAFTVSQAAQELGVSVSTVRRWYDEYLADRDEQRDSVKERRLSAQDIEALREVIKLRSEGLSQAVIKERLSETIFPAPIIESSQDAQEAPGTAMQVLQHIMDVENRTAARLEALEQSRQENALATRDTLRSVESRLWSIEQEADNRLQRLESQRLRVDVALLMALTFLAGLAVGLAVWLFQ